MTPPPESETSDRTGADRFDLSTLEFDAVRDLLLARLTTPLGRPGVRALRPCPTPDEARATLLRSAALAERLGQGDAPPLAGVVEVRSWLGAFFAGEHSPDTRDLADLKRLLRATHMSRGWLVGQPSQHLASLGQAYPDTVDLAEELGLVIDARGEILTTASVKLGEVRAQIEVADAAVRAAVQRFLGNPAVHRYLQTSEPSWRHGRPVFQVRQQHRHEIPGVLHDRSQSGATVFIEPSVVVEAANGLSDARAAEHREVQVIIAHVCRGLRRCRKEIEASVAALTDLDLLTARARLISDDGYVAPELVDDGLLRLTGARHPILLSLGSEDVVPLDIRLGDPHRILVVTGPNTGGKTVVLKTIGLLSAMAAAGVPIPADAGCQIPFFDGVFVDIGDEQAIVQNLSTFSSHVSRISRCLELASDRSLVLLDELGAGTDPEEGGALGYAVLELLEQRKATGVVTTHLGQLKDFAHRHSGAENGSMAFDGDTLRPLYRLDVGIPGQSHALDIAGQVGMPEAVVRRARERLGKRDLSMEQAVAQVQDTRRRAEEDRQRTERLRGEAERAERQLGEERQALERRQAWLQEEADSVVDEQMRELRELLEQELKELQNAPKPYGEQARRLVERIVEHQKSSSVHRRRMRFLGDVRKDGVVWAARLGRRVVVKKVDRTRETCTVEVGKMRMEIPFEDVSWLQPLDGRS